MYSRSRTVIEERNSLAGEIKHFWDLETLGIKPDQPSVYEKFIKDITHNEERYEVNLPFKESHPLLPDNYQLSKLRLESLVWWLKSNLEFLKHYDEVIQEQLEKNIIEPVNMEEQPEAGRVQQLSLLQTAPHSNDLQCNGTIQSSQSGTHC